VLLCIRNYRVHVPSILLRDDVRAHNVSRALEHSNPPILAVIFHVTGLFSEPFWLAYVACLPPVISFRLCAIHPFFSLVVKQRFSLFGLVWPVIDAGRVSYASVWPAAIFWFAHVCATRLLYDVPIQPCSILYSAPQENAYGTRLQMIALRRLEAKFPGAS